MNQDVLASEAYKALLYETHKKRKGWGHGASIRKLKYFKEFLEKNECKTIIDYGCGCSDFKGFIEKDYDYEVTEYDIGIKEKDKLNIKADFTVCVDVLEHIELEYLNNVLEHIKNHTLKGVFFSICKVPSHGSFSDGTNLHRIIKNEDWWYLRTLEYFELVKQTSLSEFHVEFLAIPKKDY
jgi:hypothetical protein